jgi:hypothetical protein
MDTRITAVRKDQFDIKFDSTGDVQFIFNSLYDATHFWQTLRTNQSACIDEVAKDKYLISIQAGSYDIIARNYQLKPYSILFAEEEACKAQLFLFNMSVLSQYSSSNLTNTLLGIYSNHYISNQKKVDLICNTVTNAQGLVADFLRGMADRFNGTEEGNFIITFTNYNLRKCADEAMQEAEARVREELQRAQAASQQRAEQLAAQQRLQQQILLQQQMLQQQQALQQQQVFQQQPVLQQQQPQQQMYVQYVNPVQTNPYVVNTYPFYTRNTQFVMYPQPLTQPPQYQEAIQQQQVQQQQFGYTTPY